MMQGLCKSGDDWIEFNDQIGIKLNKAGNRRLLEPLGEGQTHCILFHDSILPSSNMRILLANSDSELFDRFRQWLDVACPLARLNDEEQERKLYDALYHGNIIVPASADGSKKAVTINTAALFKDDYARLRNEIVNTVKAQGKSELTARTVKEGKVQTANYKKAPPFYRGYLRDAPKLYATEKQAYKKVVAKWFSPSMTWFAVEYDPNKGLLFGYVENVADPFCSEWGYFSIEELESLALGRKGTFRAYVDRDLYFEDRYIDKDGKILDAQELAQRQATSFENVLPAVLAANGATTSNLQAA
jgi:hypothetical protein